MQCSVHGAEPPSPKQLQFAFFFFFSFYLFIFSRSAFLSTVGVGASSTVRVLWEIQGKADNIIQETIYVKKQRLILRE